MNKLISSITWSFVFVGAIIFCSLLWLVSGDTEEPEGSCEW